MNWHPTFFLSNVSIPMSAVMVLAGAENGVGIITAGYWKDPTNPAFKDDPGMNEWRAFIAKYMPGADQTDVGYTYGYSVSMVMLQSLKQCNSDFSRANIMKQTTNPHDVHDPILLPSVKVSTNFHLICAMQLQKWTGTTWQRFGDVIKGAGS